MQFRFPTAASVLILLGAFSKAQDSNAEDGTVGALDVYVPPVRYPVAGAVWKKGEVRNVTWSVQLNRDYWH
jgi:hypothetical protein